MDNRYIVEFSPVLTANGRSFPEHADGRTWIIDGTEELVSFFDADEDPYGVHRIACGNERPFVLYDNFQIHAIWGSPNPATHLPHICDIADIKDPVQRADEIAKLRAVDYDGGLWTACIPPEDGQSTFVLCGSAEEAIRAAMEEAPKGLTRDQVEIYQIRPGDRVTWRLEDFVDDRSYVPKFVGNNPAFDAVFAEFGMESEYDVEWIESNSDFAQDPEEDYVDDFHDLFPDSPDDFDEDMAAPSPA